MNLRERSASGISLRRTVSYLTGGVDVADIGGNTRCTADIIQTERGDQRVAFQQQRQRLANSTSGTEDGNLGVACNGGGEEA